MAAKMKGLLKGLRFISHIFDTSSSKESSEMQIGYPTDVKHLAHIGWDGPGSAPSWMKEFPTVPSVSSGPLLPPAVTPKEPIALTSVSQDLGVAVLVQRSPRRIRNKARLHHLLDGSSSEIHPLGKPLSHRPVVDTVSSPHSHEACESSTKSSRRRQTRGILGSDSSSDQDSPRSPRPHSRPRRPRGSSSRSRLSAGFTREGLTVEPSELNQWELENGIKC